MSSARYPRPKTGLVVALFVIALVATACARVGYETSGGSRPGTCPPSRLRSPAPWRMLSCAEDRRIVAHSGAGGGPLSCAKAAVLAALLDPAAFLPPGYRPPVVHEHSTEMPSPEGSPIPPVDAREIITGGEATQYSEGLPGATVTSVWNDLESGVYVTIVALYATADPSKTEIDVDLTDWWTGSSGASIDGYTGGSTSRRSPGRSP